MLRVEPAVEHSALLSFDNFALGQGTHLVSTHQAIIHGESLEGLEDNGTFVGSVGGGHEERRPEPITQGSTKPMAVCIE